MKKFYTFSSPRKLEKSMLCYPIYFFHAMQPRLITHATKINLFVPGKFQNYSWWFQPSWKILVKMEIFPNFRGEH